MYLLAPFILQNLKKTQNRSRVMRVCHFQSNLSICPEQNFFLAQTIIITFI